MSRSAFSSDSSICPVPPHTCSRAGIYANGGGADEKTPRRRSPQGCLMVRRLLLRLARGALVLGAVQIAVAVLVGRGEALDELRVRRSFGHRDAAVLVGVERVER